MIPQVRVTHGRDSQCVPFSINNIELTNGDSKNENKD